MGSFLKADYTQMQFWIMVFTDTIAQVFVAIANKLWHLSSLSVILLEKSALDCEDEIIAKKSSPLRACSYQNG